MILASKVVKNDLKIIISIHKSKSVTHCGCRDSENDFVFTHQGQSFFAVYERSIMLVFTKNMFPRWRITQIWCCVVKRRSNQIGISIHSISDGNKIFSKSSDRDGASLSFGPSHHHVNLLFVCQIPYGLVNRNSGH